MTLNIWRHLRVTHSINLDNALSRKRSRDEFKEDYQPASGPQIKELIIVININEFRYRLTR